MTATSPLTGIKVETLRDGLADVTFYYDPICGDYALGRAEVLKELSPEDVIKLAKALATRNLQSKQTVFLTKEETGNFGSWPYLPIRELLAEYPKNGFEILDAALLNMSRMTNFPSDEININPATRWLIYAHDRDSQRYVLRQLHDMGYIRSTHPEPANPDTPRSYTIETEGWERLSSLETKAVDSNRAFVAMSFSPEMNSIYSDGIFPAVDGAKFDCFRIDKMEHNNKICDEIIAEIRRSRFLIADFTGQRGGVYFEAGFAYGLGIPVIWTVHEKDLNELHFDTRQYNHITYSDPSELCVKLRNRIEATIVRR